MPEINYTALSVTGSGGTLKLEFSIPTANGIPGVKNLGASNPTIEQSIAHLFSYLEVMTNGKDDDPNVGVVHQSPYSTTPTFYQRGTNNYQGQDVTFRLFSGTPFSSSGIDPDDIA